MIINGKMTSLKQLSCVHFVGGALVKGEGIKLLNFENASWNVPIFRATSSKIFSYEGLSKDYCELMQGKMKRSQNDILDRKIFSLY